MFWKKKRIKEERKFTLYCLDESWNIIAILEADSIPVNGDFIFIEKFGSYYENIKTIHSFTSKDGIFRYLVIKPLADDMRIKKLNSEKIN
jgi:hypothetical protein